MNQEKGTCATSCLTELMVVVLVSTEQVLKHWNLIELVSSGDSKCNDRQMQHAVVDFLTFFLY